MKDLKSRQEEEDSRLARRLADSAIITKQINGKKKKDFPLPLYYPFSVLSLHSFPITALFSVHFSSTSSHPFTV